MDNSNIRRRLFFVKSPSSGRTATAFLIFSNEECMGQNKVLLQPILTRKRPSANMPVNYPLQTRLKRTFRGILPLVVRIQAILALLFLVPVAILKPTGADAKARDAAVYSPTSPFRIRLVGDSFDADWDDCDSGTRSIDKDDLAKKRTLLAQRSSSLFGFGREFSLFESAPRGGANEDYSYGGDYDTTDEDEYSDNGDGSGEDDFFTRMERYRQRRQSVSSISSGGYNDDNGNAGYSFSRSGRPPYTSFASQKPKQRQKEKPKLLQSVQQWWMSQVDPKLQSLPKIVCRIEPTTTLKLRKTFRPLKTIIRLGADYNTQQGIWQFKSSWEDSIIGGKITLSGSKELQLTKSWQMSVGGVEDLVTRLRLRASINLQTFQAYARVGFRTERLTPIDVIEGFTILKRLPLDGSGGNLKLEVKANVALPEPEIEYRTESQAKSVTGMGDIEVSIDEMNLLLDY